MSWIKTIAQSIKSAFSTARPPAPSIPPQLLLCEAVNRPGLSAIAMASAIIARLPEAGIPTGVNPDGSENVNNKFIKIMCEEIVREIQNSARVDCSIKPGAIMAVGTGGNAGGPVTVQSQNINIASLMGLIR